MKKLTPFEWKLLGGGAVVLLLLYAYPKNYKGGSILNWLLNLFGVTSPNTSTGGASQAQASNLTGASQPVGDTNDPSQNSGVNSGGGGSPGTAPGDVGLYNNGDSSGQVGLSVTGTAGNLSSSDIIVPAGPIQ